MDLYKPAPHPAGECQFYRASWQNFLIATQPDPETGQPALQSYATIDDLFQRTIPRAKPRPWLGDLKQAGARQILIDQNGDPIYYGIHVNQGFADFVADNHLETADAIRDAPSDLFLPGHNTQAVTEKGVPVERDQQGTPLMGPKQINVSHVFSQFLLDEIHASK